MHPAAGWPAALPGQGQGLAAPDPIHPGETLEPISAGGFQLDPNLKRLVTGQGEAIKLTVLETRLLIILMSHAGVAMDTRQLVERVWGYSGEGDTLLLKNLVYRLRRKIEPDPRQPRFLLHSTESGYRFQPNGSS